MFTAYDAPVPPQRLATRKPVDNMDLHELRLLSDNLADVPAPLRVVESRDLDPCAECPEGGFVAPAVADVVYTAGAWTYTVPVCEAHARPVARWHLRYGARNLHIDIPAPALHITGATPAA